MRFRMERRAPYALAMQAGAAVAGLVVLAVQQFSPAPAPAPCGGQAQIIYDTARTCHARLDAMFRALAAPEQPGFVRAVYVRPAGGAGPHGWLDARQAAYLWRPGALAAYPALSQAQAQARAQAAQGRADARVLAYRDVMELTPRLVTKE
jgi:nitrous oxide reductase accessory protein NosL